MNRDITESMAQCPFCDGEAVPVLNLRDGQQIVACRRCDIARTEPSPAVVDYQQGDFDGQFPHRTVFELPAVWQRALDLQRDLLKRHLAPGSRILEIGCGRGLLLRHLQDAGLETTGIEPSQTATGAAVRDGLAVRSVFFARNRKQ